MLLPACRFLLGPARLVERAAGGGRRHREAPYHWPASRLNGVVTHRPNLASFGPAALQLAPAAPGRQIGASRYLRPLRPDGGGAPPARRRQADKRAGQRPGGPPTLAWRNLRQYRATRRLIICRAAPSRVRGRPLGASLVAARPSGHLIRPGGRSWLARAFPLFRPRPGLSPLARSCCEPPLAGRPSRGRQFIQNKHNLLGGKKFVYLAGELGGRRRGRRRARSRCRSHSGQSQSPSPGSGRCRARWRDFAQIAKSSRKRNIHTPGAALANGPAGARRPPLMNQT